HERAAVADWLGTIKTVVLMHWNVISARHFASPVVVCAYAVRIPCIEPLNQVLAHQVSAVIGAAEPFQRAVLQGDRLKFRKNRLAQLAPGRVVHPSAN